MKFIVVGAAGHMGREVIRILGEDFVAAKVDKFAEDSEYFSSISEYNGGADGIIDFSNHASAPELAEYAAKNKIPIVIATTGHTPIEKKAIEKAAEETAVFYSANMSLGIAVLCKAAREIAGIFRDADIEIIEKHHNRKLDAPSGTALMLAEAVKEGRDGDAEFVLGRSGSKKREKDEIGIHALRMANVVGEHEVIIATDTQTITLKHEAHTRALFAEGAVEAAKYIIGKAPGLYDMKNLTDK